MTDEQTQRIGGRSAAIFSVFFFIVVALGGFKVAVFAVLGLCEIAVSLALIDAGSRWLDSKWPWKDRL